MKEKEILKNLKREIKNIKLSPEERARIFEHVINSPILSSYAPIRSIWVLRRRVFVYIMASLLVFVLGSSGVVYASLYALPGDDLYAMKIKVTEPALDVLAFTPVARAERKAQKVVRRLDEVEKLILKDEFTIEHKTALEKKFHQNADDFNTAIELIKDESSIKKEKLKADLEVSLIMHIDKIQKISLQKNIEKNVEIKVDKENKQEKVDTENIKDVDKKEKIGDIKINAKIDAEIDKQESTEANTKAVFEIKDEDAKSKIISEFEKVVKDRILLNKNTSSDLIIIQEEKKDIKEDTKTEEPKDPVIEVKEEAKVETEIKIDTEVEITKDEDIKILPLIPKTSLFKIN